MLSKFDPKFFTLNATAAETMVFVVAIYPLYWVFKLGLYFIPIYLTLIVAHLILFMSTQCEKCSYNTTCPGGLAWQKCRKQLIGKKSNG